jgi:hypothetical protein
MSNKHTSLDFLQAVYLNETPSTSGKVARGD